MSGVWVPQHAPRPGRALIRLALLLLRCTFDAEDNCHIREVARLLLRGQAGTHVFAHCFTQDFGCEVGVSPRVAVYCNLCQNVLNLVRHGRCLGVQDKHPEHPGPECKGQGYTYQYLHKILNISAYQGTESCVSGMSRLRAESRAVRGLSEGLLGRLGALLCRPRATKPSYYTTTCRPSHG